MKKHPSFFREAVSAEIKRAMNKNLFENVILLLFYE